MKYILFDGPGRELLFPFTHTRAVAGLRCGILTMHRRWQLMLNTQVGMLTTDVVAPTLPQFESTGDEVYINGAVFPSHDLMAQIATLPEGYALLQDHRVIAARTGGVVTDLHHLRSLLTDLAVCEVAMPVQMLEHPWHIFSLNEQALLFDYQLLTAGRKSQPIPAGVQVSGAENLFIEEGAVIGAGTIINASTGPVYIGAGAEIMEGCIIRGPFAACAHSVLKMGAKVYGATTLGPGCKVGGEVSNVVFFANSNKGHDGFLGNAVIGEWCNLGADTNCSNLKNNYGTVKVWQESTNSEVSTGLTFCGLLMGDHSKCGINTMFNTGTVVGVSCNIYGGDFPAKYIPSFSWGGSDGFTVYGFDKAMETATRMMARRGKTLSTAEIEMYRSIYNARG